MTGRRVSGRGSDLPGVCVVGCGAWGGVHAAVLKSMGSRVRRFFASRTAARARDFARRFAGEPFDTVEAALSDARVTSVVIATPHDLHAPLTRLALNAGKHVLVEKPIALSLDEAIELVELAGRQDLRFAVAEQYRLSPLFQALSRALHEGWIGTPLFAIACSVTTFVPAERWKHAIEATGGGVLIDVGIHYIDLLRALFGAPAAIRVTTASESGESRAVPETAISALLDFRDGPSAHLSVTWRGHRRPGAPNLEVIGENGALQFDFRRPRVLHSTRLPARHWTGRFRDALPWRAQTIAAPLLRRLPQSRLRHIPVRADDLIGSRALIQDFLDACRLQRKPAVPAAEGVLDLAIVLAGYESLRTGKTVKIADARRDAAPPPATGVRTAGGLT